MARSIKPDFHVCHLCGAQYKEHNQTNDQNCLFTGCPSKNGEWGFQKRR